MPPHKENLGDGLILRAVRDERDVERYAAFNGAVVNPAEGNTCALLLRHHPRIRRADFLFVEDQRRGEIVSTTCLIPWHCRYENIILDAAMLEMVATHPGYRHRGLVRAQLGRFHQVVGERRFDLSIIQGIPYYYRQYGYTYAIDNWASDSLPAWRIPGARPGQHRPYRLRPARPDDVPTLACLYEEAMAPLQFHALRSQDHWRFLLQWAQWPVRLVEDQRDGRPAGYVVTTPPDGNGSIRVPESAIASYEAALSVLQALKEEAGSEIRLGWPQQGTLVQVGRSLGSTPLPHYQWLLRIPSVLGLLSKIGSVLERRLVVSALAGFTASLCINLYREAFVLRFRRGKLVEVEPTGFVDASMGAEGGDINLPPEAFTRLVFGYRTLDDLRDAWPDIVVRPGSCYLVGVLFPRMTSYLCTPYLYHGATRQPAGSPTVEEGEG